ncbi:MAG: endonuclease domain-containing protein, partial [Candidatus Doudnabacteria bacterium]|nr:endonuclease domain-containing protein [Candidatus Doudnabacteria bacterium]
MQINRNLLAKSRKLRKTQTPWEDRLWHYLRSKRFQGYRFRRQFVIGRYIVDFYCYKKKLVIEVDGGQHNEVKNIIKDRDRTKYLTKEGYKVLRFWNSDLNDNFEGVLDTI